MRRLNSHKRILLVIFFFTIFLGLSFKINNSHAQELIEPLNISSKFEMVEFAEINDISKGVSSIDIPLTSATWNITSIELNFTDIKLGKEIKTIEDNEDGFWVMTWRTDNAIGVQINITEHTLIYGVFLKGFRSGNPMTSGYVQINGYNITADTPDNNILGSTLINITGGLAWYLQEFNDPISLPSGQYYLVINGSGIMGKDDKFWIAENTLDSINYNLKKSTLDFDETNWILESTGEPLLYKLVQRVNISFNPEEINMTVDIDGHFFPVLDGENEATGFLNVSETIIPNAQNFNIPISNNQSIGLIFNVSYCLKSQNLLISDCDVSIKENSINWTLNPQIERSCDNHSVKFSYPINWFNLKVKRNNEDISLNVTIDVIKNVIFIPNNTIHTGATWEISANSPQIDFNLDFPKLQFTPGQKMNFSIEEPLLQGNYTFDLINPLGNRYYVDKKEIPPGNNTFSYEIPAAPHEGNYKVCLFWNNLTDAGLQTQEFTVTISPYIKPLTFDFQLLFTILLTISIIAISGFSLSVAVKRINRRIKDRQQQTINKVKDVLNLYYIIVTEKNSGLTIYDQLFAGKNIDSTLISGFLQAIRAFGIELTEAEDHSQTIKLDYKNLTILMSEFKGFRLIFVMRESPSPIFLDTIKTLSYNIDNKYAVFFDNFDGSLNEFKGIKDLMEQHLRTSLLHPFKVTPQNIKINTDEKTIIDRASTMMKTNNADHFFIFNLLSVDKGFQVKGIKIILNLIKKKIFQHQE